MSQLYRQDSYRIVRGVNGTGVANIYSSALQLLLLVGMLALKVPQALGHWNTKSILGMSDQMKGMWLKLGTLDRSQHSSELFAVCHMQPSLDLAADLPAVSGYIVFYQNGPWDQLQAYFQLAGFPQDAEQPNRAIHVHQFGDLSGGCSSTGPHFNPLNVNHPNHPGDFNNFQVRNGMINKHLKNLRASLYGMNTIIGRGVVIHAQEDDLGLGGNLASLQNGNSGKRLACCTIGISNGDLWKKMVPSV
ncbi:extracellular superoxide dismutase [Cu-Zn]-like [Carcharodon carcharias]|uniref:extracellular superoxide dismutase [Cu-Zn]-like n=1 Tax=Carcharodon carcharias TaxID=13397 RepID=UPI001B7E3081|nr:extracellular superoxide dismutase [Cu-Zn]-like [Carcharodon carcharias]